MPHLETRPLDPERDWGFFEPEVRPADHDLEVIRPLTEDAACALWSALVSGDPAQRHPMLLHAGHWLEPRSLPGLDWEQLWRSDPVDVDADPLVRMLDARLAWKPEDHTVFFWMREQAVILPWGTFRRSWRPFLFSDEGPFLINLRAPEVVCFGPHGTVGVASRPLTQMPEST